MSLRDIYETSFDESDGRTINTTTCPECTGDLATEGGETSCLDCGLIIDDRRLDRGPEWRSFDDDDTRKRTGAPLTPARHDRGLSTEISYGTDAKGNPLSGRKRKQIARLRRYHSRAQFDSTADRNLAHACGEIARITSGLDLPRSVREQASAIYREAQQHELIQGRSVEIIAAGSVYAACRCRGYPRSVEEIGAIASCPVEKVTLGYRVLNIELGLDAQVVGVTERIPRLATDCGASSQVRYRALELAREAETAGIANGRNPAGVAAACVYLAGREYEAGHTQADLATAAEVTPLTLRVRYYELRAISADGSAD